MSVVLTVVGITALVGAMAALIGINLCIVVKVSKKAEANGQNMHYSRFVHGGLYHPYF